MLCLALAVILTQYINSVASSTTLDFYRLRPGYSQCQEYDITDGVLYAILFEVTVCYAFEGPLSAASVSYRIGAEGG